MHEAGCKCDGNERSVRSKTTVYRKRYHLNFPPPFYTKLKDDDFRFASTTPKWNEICIPRKISLNVMISGLKKKKVVNYCRVIFEPTSASKLQAPPVILQCLETHPESCRCVSSC